MTGGDGKPVPITVYAPNCAGLRDLTGESKEILGIKVLHMVTNGSQKAADGSILTHVEDAWLAPSFNCKALYDHQTWTYNGKPDGDKEEVATSAVLGEPDAALFQIHGEEATPEVFYAATGYPKAGPPKMKQYLADKAARAALGLP